MSRLSSLLINCCFLSDLLLATYRKESSYCTLIIAPWNVFLSSPHDNDAGIIKLLGNQGNWKGGNFRFVTPALVTFGMQQASISLICKKQMVSDLDRIL